MFCTNCGSQIPDGSAFCTNCGTPAGGASPAKQVDPDGQQAYGEQASYGAVSQGAPDWTSGAAPYGTGGAAPAWTSAGQNDQQAHQQVPWSADPGIEPPRKKRSAGKVAAIAALVLVVLAAAGAGGYLAYTTFFAEGPEHAIAADLGERLDAYSDPEAGEGDRLMAEADSVLSGLGAYASPEDEAYESWLNKTSVEVGEVTVAEDGETATATATVTHPPLISYIEHYMGEADDAGEDQETELTVEYQRDGSEWTVDSDDLRDAVFEAYLPTDEELILSDVNWYFEIGEEETQTFVQNLEESSGSDLDDLGISAEDFAVAYLEGYGYEVGDVTVDGNTATVDVSYSIKSMDQIVATFQDEFTTWANSVDPSTITSEDDLYKQGGKILLEVAQEAEPQQNDIVITFTQDGDGVWWMDSSSQHDLSGVVGV